MITAVVTFKIPPGITRAQWMEQTRSVATRFQTVPGLIRKQFLYSDQGLAGGVYLWETREAAETCYRGPWRDNVLKASGGSEPNIAWFDTEVVVDNESHQIKTAA
jgi:Putative mono-oxygenase ydhR